MPCAGFAIELIFGGLPGFREALGLPLTLTMRIAAWADHRLNRLKRSKRSRRMWGALVVLFLMLLAAIVGLYAADFCRSVADG